MSKDGGGKPVDPRKAEGARKIASLTLAGDSNNFNAAFLDGLVKAGLDINAQNPDNGNTLLHEAVQRDNQNAIDLLVEHGSDPKIKNKDGKSSVDLNPDNKTLKDAVAQLDAQKMFSAKPELFARAGALEKLNHFKSNGVDLNKLRDNDGNTLLHKATNFASINPEEGLEAMKVLIDSGVDIKAQNNKGETAMHLAAKDASTSRDPKVMKELVSSYKEQAGKNGVSEMTNMQDDRGNTPLHNLVNKEKSGFVSMPSGKLFRGSSQIVETKERESVVKFLVEDGKADVSIENNDGKKPSDVAGSKMHDYIVGKYESKESERPKSERPKSSSITPELAAAVKGIDLKGAIKDAGDSKDAPAQNNQSISKSDSIQR